MHTRSNPQGSIAQGQVRRQGDQEEVERRQDRSRRQEGQGRIPCADRGAEGVDL